MSGTSDLDSWYSSFCGEVGLAGRMLGLGRHGLRLRFGELSAGTLVSTRSILSEVGRGMRYGRKIGVSKRR